MTKPVIGKWALSPHAAMRMMERHVSIANLEETLHNPDWVQRQGPKWILAKQFKERRDNMLAAVVIEREENNLWIVLTVMVHFELKRT